MNPILIFILGLSCGILMFTIFIFWRYYKYKQLQIIEEPMDPETRKGWDDLTDEIVKMRVRVSEMIVQAENLQKSKKDK